MSYSLIKQTKVSTVDRLNLDSAAKVMVQNDNNLLPHAGIKPTIWCCRWYNTMVDDTNRQTCCYNKGDMVWLNTEDLEQFAISNKDYICAIARKNNILAPLLAEAELGNSAEVIQLLEDIASGKVSGNPSGLPLYCIGNLGEPARIRVSLVDGNDRLPTDDTCWRDFFADTSQTKLSKQLADKFIELLNRGMSTHLQQYHLSGMQEWMDSYNNELSSQYLLKDFSNVTKVQEYSPAPGSTDSGFDHVIFYHHKVYGSGKTCKWFRVWKSGFLEHGGIVQNSQSAATQMEDSFAYVSPSTQKANCYEVNLAWSYNDGASIAPTYTYPTAMTGFGYDDFYLDFGAGETFQQQKAGLQLSPEARYSVQVTPLLKSSREPYSTLHISRGNAKWYMSREVNTMCNGSFRFELDDDVEYYAYKVSGFSENSQWGFWL